MAIQANRGTDWQLAGFHATATFRRKPKAPDSLQRREHLIAEVWRNLQHIQGLVDTEVGTSLRGTELQFLPGDGFTAVRMTTRVIGLNVQDLTWRCTSDGVDPSPAKENLWRHSQTWEALTQWEDDTAVVNT